MKIARNNTALSISLTANERAALRGSRCRVQLNATSKNEWLILTGTEDLNDRSIYSNARDSEHPFRVDTVQNGLPLFGVETVDCRVVGGSIYVNAPRMNRPLIERSKREKRPIAHLAAMPGIEEAKQAVMLINNMKEAYGNQIEITVEEGKLRIRMMLEL
jgi:hypothetical protein